VYVLSTLLFPFGLLTLKKTGAPVANVWYGFVFFQLFRALCFTGRLWGGAVLSSIGSVLGIKKKEGGESALA
jgi:hypothetical protein